MKTENKINRKPFLSFEDFEKIYKQNIGVEGVYIIMLYEKAYIGSSKDIIKRVHNHCVGKGNPALFSDIIVYGTDFLGIQLYECDWNKKAVERTLIEALTSLGISLYNEV